MGMRDVVEVKVEREGAEPMCVYPVVEVRRRAVWFTVTLHGTYRGGADDRARLHEVVCDAVTEALKVRYPGRAVDGACCSMMWADPGGG